MEQGKFFDPESYIMVQYEKACQHSADCVQEIVLFQLCSLYNMSHIRTHML